MLLFIFFGLTLLSCNFVANNTQKNSDGEDFDQFYKKFLNDSNLQLERIKFPLKGEYIDADLLDIDGKYDSTSLLKEWEKEDWVIFKEINKDVLKDLDISRQQNDNSVIIITKGKGFGFYMEEHYQKIDNVWFLIYYVEKNM